MTLSNEENTVGDFACQTIDPNNPTGPKIDVIFPGDYTLCLYKYARVRYENLRAAKYVLEHTERIFYGVQDSDQGGWCYVGRPAEWYAAEGVIAPFPDKRIFAVYVNPNMRVYLCRDEYVDERDARCPENWMIRYRGILWKSTSWRT